MDLERFNALIKNPSATTDADATMLREIVAEYPYFQAAHLLLANATKDSEEIQRAALHTAHRSVLKKVLNSEFDVEINLPNLDNIDLLQDDFNALEQLSDDDFSASLTAEQDVTWPQDETNEQSITTEEESPYAAFFTEESEDDDLLEATNTNRNTTEVSQEADVERTAFWEFQHEASSETTESQEATSFADAETAEQEEADLSAYEPSEISYTASYEYPTYVEEDTHHVDEQDTEASRDRDELMESLAALRRTREANAQAEEDEQEATREREQAIQEAARQRLLAQQEAIRARTEAAQEAIREKAPDYEDENAQSPYNIATYEDPYQTYSPSFEDSIGSAPTDETQNNIFEGDFHEGTASAGGFHEGYFSQGKDYSSQEGAKEQPKREQSAQPAQERAPASATKPGNFAIDDYLRDFEAQQKEPEAPASEQIAPLTTSYFALDDLLANTPPPRTSSPPPDEAVSKQQKLIDAFIEQNPLQQAPKVPRPLPEAPTDQTDLAQRSVEQSSLAVSENLAQILAKQGKNEKAIEIYDALMLKYPEKSAYFAAQIQFLENK